MRFKYPFWHMALVAILASCAQAPQLTPTAARGTSVALPPTWTDTPESIASPIPRPSGTPTSSPTVSPLAVRTRRPSESDFEDIPSIWEQANATGGLDLEEPGTREFTVELPSEQPFIWPFYWCATDVGRLNENLLSLQVEFAIDGKPVPTGYLLEFEEFSGEWDCHYWATMLLDWRPGSQISLTVKYRFGQAVFDGQKEYPAGDYYYRLLVTPIHTSPSIPPASEVA